MVRNSAAFPEQHPQLTVFQEDVLQPASFKSVLQGVDVVVVVSCLGIQQREPTTVYSQGVTNMLQAMQVTGVTRIICLSAIAVEVPSGGPWLIKVVTRHILPRLFKHLYADMLRMEAVLRESELNWTMIRPPQLTDKNTPDTTERPSTNRFKTRQKSPVPTWPAISSCS